MANYSPDMLSSRRTYTYSMLVLCPSHLLHTQLSINCSSILSCLRRYDRPRPVPQESAQLRHGILSVVGAACSQSNVDLALLFQEIDAVFTPTPRSHRCLGTIWVYLRPQMAACPSQQP